MAAERAGYIITNILDPKYKISPPEIPAKCTQQRGGSTSTNYGDVYMCLHIPAQPEFPPACPALLSGTYGI